MKYFNRNRNLDVLIYTCFSFLFFSIFFSCKDKNKTPIGVDSKELRLLGWVGYDEPDLLHLIKEKTGIDVAVKTFIGGSGMMNILKSDTSSYDVVVLDPEFISVAKNFIESLNPDDFDFTHYHSFFKNLDLIKIGGQLFAVPVRFGIIGILYNEDRVNVEDIRQYSSLFDEKFKNRISTIDLWQPVMGTISLCLGHKEAPYNITMDELQEVKQNIIKLKEHGLRIHTSVAGLLEALSDESSWIMLGGGEANAEALINRGKNFNWTVPDEGGILWMESLGIVKNTKRKDAAIKLIQFLQSPEGQALLARRKTYISSPPSLSSLLFLSREELRIRGIPNEKAMTDLLDKVVIRKLPNKDMIEAWNDAWREIKSHR